METPAETRAAGDPPLEKLLRTAWAEETRNEKVEELPLRPELLAAACLQAAERASYFQDLLAKALESFDGERAFVFELARSRGAAPEVSGCAASRDLDGDPVPSPRKKVPPPVLFEAAEGGRPAFRRHRDASDEGGRQSSLLVLPACSRERARALLVVENRFQDLGLREARLHAFFHYCRHLAWQLDLAALAEENEGLWHDLARLRESDARREPGHVAEAPPARSTGTGARKGLHGDYSMIVGSSPKLFEILQVIDRISGSDAPVLIHGESGTGKELVALAVHKNSPRRGKPFVSENCAAITESLLESELFGYVKGAFTGASKDHKGLFEVASGGTLFLDEVGDMSASMQKKLLRVLQEGVIRRVGAKESTPVDVRIISATNKDLLAECRKGSFREDLYYRLNVINLKLPPLRERREDIHELVQFLLEEHERETGRPTRVDPQAMQKLVQYTWPGNVRELQNEVKKVCALAEGEVIRPEDLSETLVTGENPETGVQDWPFDLSQLTLKEATERLEKEMIRNALRETEGNKSLVAKTLQIPKTSLYNKIHKYKLA